MSKRTARGPVRPHEVLVLVLGLFASFVLGLLLNRVPPAVDDPADFWIGNLCAPFVLLPALMAWLLRRGAAISALVGVLVVHVAFAGFYSLIWERTGGAWHTGLLSVSLHGWTPYVVALGVTMGAVGAAARSRGLLGALIAVVLVAEPIIHLSGAATVLPLPNLAPSRLAWNGHNVLVLGTELLVGLVVAGTWTWLRRRSASRP